MGILQAGYRTYEAQAHQVGKAKEGKEALTPVAHAMQNAHIEVEISPEGAFRKANPVAKAHSKTIIPVTTESANRTGDNTKAHPLCDQLRYLAPFGGDKFAAYLGGLAKWAHSEFSHPKVHAVHAYILGGTIVRDLAETGLITLDAQGRPGAGKIEGTAYDKCLVRWHVTPAPEGISTASWEDPTLFASYAAFYAEECAGAPRDLCLLSGEEDMVCTMHPKGVVARTHGAKLVSANDKSGFTYRGRFTQPEEAYSIGFTASQKAHHALRWVAVNHGVIYGGRTFLCWNPEGQEMPMPLLFGLPSEAETDLTAYKKQLSETLRGYRQALPETSGIVIAALDAATTGRLSVTYFSELQASDFLDRVQHWYETLGWLSFGRMWAPGLRRIVNCAFGTQRGNFIEADDAILAERIQTLLRCMIDRQPLPFDMVHALTVRASTPLAYKPANREILLRTACAMIRKYRNDKLKKEEWTLALDTSNDDRSYLFGRLLAIVEQVERSTYDRGEERETNAIRMQSTFSQRPMAAWRILEERLQPYYARHPQGLRQYYKNMIGEIADLLPCADDPALGQKLDDVYLLGYHHQRSALFTKKEPTDPSVKEDGEYESAEE